MANRLVLFSYYAFHFRYVGGGLPMLCFCTTRLYTLFEKITISSIVSSRAELRYSACLKLLNPRSVHVYSF